MNPTSKQSPCATVDFESLLFGDDSSAVYLASANHVEGCPACQERLERLAGDDTQWAAVREFLRPGQALPSTGLSTSGQTTSLPGHPRPRHMKLDFLNAPSHPEMLGRLGRYEIESVIGAGGMGIVLKGFDTELNRPVAIKVLSPHLSHSAAARQRFAREARAAASIVHEHVVSIHDVDAQQDAPFLVMQYVAGQSLAERVEQQGPLSPTEVLRIGIQAAAGLAAAHSQGVIHRDVKPANILLESGVERAMLTDFGLARAADDATLTHSGVLAGTPHYMSPEQARGEVLDGRSDLFSLGATMYFMTTGHPPFRAEQAMAVLHRVCNDVQRSVQDIDPMVPDALADAIDRLLEKRPGRRYASASEAQHALERTLVRLQQPARMSVTRWLRRRVRRKPIWMLAAACLLVAAFGGGLYLRPEIAGMHAPQSQTVSPAPEKLHFVDVPLDVFASEWADVDRSIKQLENVEMPVARTNRAAPNPWSREVQAIDNRLQQLEKLEN